MKNYIGLEREILRLKKELQLAKSQIEFERSFHDLGGRRANPEEDISTRDAIWGAIQAKHLGGDGTLKLQNVEIGREIEKLSRRFEDISRVRVRSQISKNNRTRHRIMKSQG